MVIYRSKLGEKHPQYASVIGNLGALYQKMGEFSKAQPFIRADANFRSLSWKKYNRVCWRNKHFAYCNFRAGKDSSIKDLYKEALVIRKNLLDKSL